MEKCIQHLPFSFQSFLKAFQNIVDFHQSSFQGCPSERLFAAWSQRPYPGDVKNIYYSKLGDSNDNSTL